MQIFWLWKIVENNRSINFSAKWKECPAGYYCPGDNIEHPCPEWNYCPAKSSTYTVCPCWHYCPALSSEPTSCGWATKYSAKWSKSPSDCKTAEKWYYADSSCQQYPCTNKKWSSYYTSNASTNNCNYTCSPNYSSYLWSCPTPWWICTNYTSYEWSSCSAVTRYTLDSCKPVDSVYTLTECPKWWNCSWAIWYTKNNNSCTEYKKAKLNSCNEVNSAYTLDKCPDHWYCSEAGWYYKNGNTCTYYTKKKLDSFETWYDRNGNTCIKKNPAVNWKCGSTHYNCTAGNAVYTSDNTTQWTWTWTCQWTNWWSSESCHENYSSGYPECWTTFATCKKWSVPGADPNSWSWWCYYAWITISCEGCSVKCSTEWRWNSISTYTGACWSIVNINNICGGTCQCNSIPGDVTAISLSKNNNPLICWCYQAWNHH